MSFLFINAIGFTSVDCEKVRTDYTFLCARLTLTAYEDCKNFSNMTKENAFLVKKYIHLR